jgi:hypothetical protein
LSFGHKRHCSGATSELLWAANRIAQTEKDVSAKHFHIEITAFAKPGWVAQGPGIDLAELMPFLVVAVLSTKKLFV